MPSSSAASRSAPSAPSRPSRPGSSGPSSSVVPLRREALTWTPCRLRPHVRHVRFAQLQLFNLNVTQRTWGSRKIEGIVALRHLHCPAPAGRPATAPSPRFRGPRNKPLASGTGGFLGFPYTRREVVRQMYAYRTREVTAG